MRKKIVFIACMALVCLIGTPLCVQSQFSLTGQIRTRTEFRNGYGTLEPIGDKPAFLTSQRSRLTLHFQSARVIFHVSVQDVRVWGADAATISNADGSRLSVHEAWADLVLANARDSAFPKSAIEYFSVKIGRQELVYDDERLLGNLDWLQQGRRHDVIVFKLIQRGWQADLGVAFNQNTDAINYNGTYYTPANIPAYVKDSKGDLVPTPAGMLPLTNATGISAKTGSPFVTAAPSTDGMNQNYKAMQFLYVAKKFNRTKISGLLFADEFGKYMTDSIKTVAGTDTGYVYGRQFNQSGVNTRVTGGFLLNSQLDSRKAWALTAGFYYQTGKDKDGLTLGAYMSTLSLSLTRRHFSWTAGWDYLSGNDAFSSSTTNHRFDPLYGTPHKFWGAMDYFYAASGSATGGLNNPFLKSKYVSTNERLTIGLDYHYFGLAGEQKDVKGAAVRKYLGSEADLIGSYKLNKITQVEAGFCYLAASGSMEYAKTITPGSSRLNATWAYLQINIRPDLLGK
ncbi:MAG: alginate export family protein [Puia sp.]|nr:alginate export family protein [Puia sp.]